MISGKMYRFRVPETGIDPRFVEAYLQTDQARNAINEMKTGISDSGLNLTHDRFRPLRVPVAPFAEQRRIMDVYEEVVTDLEAGVHALDRAPAKLEEYRAAVLKAAVNGTLTAEWRAEHQDVEPASELLKRILVERRRRWEEDQLRKFKEKNQVAPKNWKERYKEPVAPDPTILPGLPENWCICSIDNLIREPLRNGHSARTTDDQNGVPTFSLTAVTEGDFSEKNIKITRADPAKIRDLWVASDDIFVERSNTPELVGTARRYSGASGRAIFPDLLIRVRIAPLILSAFVEICLQSPYCHSYFRKKAQGISGSMPKIDQEVIERTAIPLPSVAEQEAIVELVEDQISVIDHLETDLNDKIRSSQSLRQAILQHAFSGKLVPQDPNDEPAWEMLKRIATERETHTSDAGNGRRQPRRRARATKLRESGAAMQGAPREN
jgi:type I restriction enzyme S subunit